MNKIVFYKNSQGYSDLKTYFDFLAAQGTKDSRVKLKKSKEFLILLMQHGRGIGEPYIKPLNTRYDLWELRPTNLRILFYCYNDTTFILLNYYLKKSNKTPIKEIKKAINIIKLIKERGFNEEDVWFD